MARYSGTERLEARKARLERHAAETDAGVVLKAAARYLELRTRSIDEVRWHLRAARFPQSVVEEAIARLVELAFAQEWVESRARAKPRGSQALRRGLARSLDSTHSWAKARSSSRPSSTSRAIASSTTECGNRAARRCHRTSSIERVRNSR